MAAIHEATEAVQRLQHTITGWTATTTSWTIRFPSNFNLIFLTMQSRTRGGMRVFPSHVYGDFTEQHYMDLHLNGSFTRIQFSLDQARRMRDSMPRAYDLNLAGDLSIDRDYGELLPVPEYVDLRDDAREPEPPTLDLIYTFGGMPLAIPSDAAAIIQAFRMAMNGLDGSDALVQLLMDATHRADSGDVRATVLTNTQRDRLLSKLVFAPMVSECPICCDTSSIDAHTCTQCKHTACRMCVNHIIDTRQCFVCPFCRYEINAS